MLIVQVPVVMKVSAPPEVIVHTPVVEEVKETDKLEEADAESVGVVPKL